VEYDDGLIACSDEGITIRKYDALLRPKRVRYEEIRRVEEFPLSGMHGKWRIWGSGDLSLHHSFNMDWHRPRKQIGLLLDLGQRTQPVITPDEPEQVVAVLREHGIQVTER